LSYAKEQKYRSKKLLEAARDCPFCFGCGMSNDGSVVAAHSNQHRDGKGLGTKSHDFRVAYLCHRCHTFVDQSTGSIEKKLELWEEAHRATVGYWFLSGLVK